MRHVIDTLYIEIEGHPGYLIGSDGTLWSRCTKTNGHGKAYEAWRPHPVQRYAGGSRHCVVSLRTTKKPTRRLVHELVLESFIGPCPEGMYAYHHDGDTANNHVVNLGYVAPDDLPRTPRPKVQRKPNIKAGEARLIRDLMATGAVTRPQLARRFGLAVPTIANIIKHRTHKGA